MYYTEDTSCATVANDAADTVAITAGAACSSITVSVNVTIGSTVFQASDSVTVTRLSSVSTFMDAYPSGASDISSLHPVLCTSVFERGQLRSVGTLETGETGTLTCYFTYASSDTSVSGVSSTIVTPLVEGTTSFGGLSELTIASADLTGVTINGQRENRHGVFVCAFDGCSQWHVALGR